MALGRALATVIDKEGVLLHGLLFILQRITLGKPDRIQVMVLRPSAGQSRLLGIAAQRDPGVGKDGEHHAHHAEVHADADVIAVVLRVPRLTQPERQQRVEQSDGDQHPGDQAEGRALGDKRQRGEHADAQPNQDGVDVLRDLDPRFERTGQHEGDLEPADAVRVREDQVREPDSDDRDQGELLPVERHLPGGARLRPRQISVGVGGLGGHSLFVVSGRFRHVAYIQSCS